MAKRKPAIHQMTVRELEARFPDEDACKAYLVAHRWPHGVRCPRCDNDQVTKLVTRPWHWQCYSCSAPGTSYRFSVLVGTIFENTNYPLKTWFTVMHWMLVSKKGISALQVYRMIGMGSYRTAWSMCHRIRASLRKEAFRKLIGYVEVDETFVGGKAKNKHRGKGGRGDFGGTGGTGKEIVVGAIQRKGNVVARVIENTTADTLNEFVRETVSHRVSLISTDEHLSYRQLDQTFPHGMVNHGDGEYVHGNIHTNNIESFWSIFKRGIVGTFHKVSRKYLPLYVAEFQFRHNNRRNPDIFSTAIKEC